ncbi:unnamed protein product, partial [Arabidopsis halleri]
WPSLSRRFFLIKKKKKSVASTTAPSFTESPFAPKPSMTSTNSRSVATLWRHRAVNYLRCTISSQSSDLFFLSPCRLLQPRFGALPTMKRLLSVMERFLLEDGGELEIRIKLDPVYGSITIMYE